MNDARYRFDEAAVSLQKEKNMYKEIENYPTCFKVRVRVQIRCTDALP